MPAIRAIKYGNRTSTRRVARVRKPLSKGKSWVRDNVVAPLLGAGMGPTGYFGMGLARQAKWAMDKKNKKRRTTKRYGSSSVYSGRFRKGSKKGANSFGKYTAKGVVDTIECSGSVSDPDCCYLNHSYAAVQDVFYASVRALVRKLLDKANIRVKSTTQIIPGITLVDSSFWRFSMVSQIDVSGTLSTTNYDTSTGDTVASVAAGFYSILSRYSSGFLSTVGVSGNNDNLLEPIKFQLYERGIASESFHIVCELDMKEENIDLKTVTKLKIQNRTKASSGSGDAEDVSATPIVGRVYQFSDVPRSKVESTHYQYNRISFLNGITLIRAAEMTAVGPSGATTKEPPLPSEFYNCRKSAVVRLQPGEIKESVVVHSKKMNYLLFLKKMRMQFSQTGFDTNYVFGPCEMYAFEDVINVNASELINLAYEKNTQIGVFFTTSRKTFMDGTYSQVTLNNLTP